MHIALCSKPTRFTRHIPRNVYLNSSHTVHRAESDLTSLISPTLSLIYDPSTVRLLSATIGHSRARTHTDHKDEFYDDNQINKFTIYLKDLCVRTSLGNKRVVVVVHLLYKNYWFVCLKISDTDDWLMA